MRKIIVLIVSFMFLVSSNIQASLFAPSVNPYSFGPHGRSVADLRDFAKPKQMANILAGRPVVATKVDGTRVYYSPDGKLCLSIKRNGEMSFSLGGHSMNLDKNGKLRSETKTFKGNYQEVRDEFGDITGYNQLDGNGKVIASYDEDMNKTTIYHYGKFGKALEYSVNLMNKQKTVYDSNERAIAVYDADGYILTSYQYEDVSYESAEDRKTLLEKKNSDKKNRRLLTTKTYGNDFDGVNSDGSLETWMAHTTTYFNGDGLISYVEDSNGNASQVYHYEQDFSGNTVLQYVLDTKTKEKTYYENNKQMYVLNDMGTKIREFYWNGSKYLFSADYDSNGNWEFTTDKKGLKTASGIVYNKDGQIDKRSENGQIVEKYFYRTDIDGREVLDYIENVLDNTKTYYEYDYDTNTACSTKTVDAKGNIITDYSWNDGKLVYSFDRDSGTTTWYIQGNDSEPIAVYESFEDRIMSRNIYSDGQLIGQCVVVHGKNSDGEDVVTYKLLIFVNERQEFELVFDKEPTVDQTKYLVNRFINTGIMTTDTVYDEDGNKAAEWEYIKRTDDEQKGVAKLVYNLRVYTEDNDSFVVEYEGFPKFKDNDSTDETIDDTPTTELISFIVDYKKETGSKPTSEMIRNYLLQHQEETI